MEGTHFSLVALSIFILLTVRCWCEEAYNPLTEAGSDRDLKRFDDVGYDSFLGLMGWRNAALTNRTLITALLICWGGEQDGTLCLMDT